MHCVTCNENSSTVSINNPLFTKTVGERIWPHGPEGGSVVVTECAMVKVGESKVIGAGSRGARAIYQYKRRSPFFCIPIKWREELCNKEWKEVLRRWLVLVQ